ncbi:MAG: hypothetical protein WC516_04765 [Patescibacteria group bacterium]|jgi:endogenous inhibitor of DNA gyrase (YacG/DUF329 family)
MTNKRQTIICKICNKEIDINDCHIFKIHKLTKKQYYDLYLKKENNEGKCLICGKEIKFLSSNVGYNKCCSRQCGNKYRNNILFEKYGVINNFQLDSVKQKSKETLLEKYGV